jgi:hypothetical protein
MKVKDLRLAITNVDDEMIVLLRVSDEDGGNQFLCSPSGAVPDPGCGDVEAFIIDGTDGNASTEYRPPIVSTANWRQEI